MSDPTSCSFDIEPIDDYSDSRLSWLFAWRPPAPRVIALSYHPQVEAKEMTCRCLSCFRVFVAARSYTALELALAIPRLDELHAHRRTDFDGVSGWREPSRLLVDPKDDD